jgi:GNAT superfamily N-acetyltransferase
MTSRRHYLPTSVSPVAKTALDAIQAKQSALCAGYDMVIERQDIYQDLLDGVAETLWTTIGDTGGSSGSDSSKKNNVKRRQTPLVNAGYAARVLAISNSILSFVKYHGIQNIAVGERQDGCGDDVDNNTVKGPLEHIDAQIVVLGCGVDVISIWAAQMANLCSPSCSIRVIEIDTPNVCRLKREVLLGRCVDPCANYDSQQACKPMVTNLIERQSVNGDVYYEGSIFYQGNPSESKKSDYLLIPADLTKDLDNVELFLNNREYKIPTFVLSELVLSYIPPVSTDKILVWCSQKLCQKSGSVFFALEPLGFVPTGQSKICRSVTEGYQRDYCQKFVNKVERGKAKSSNNENNANDDKDKSTEQNTISPSFHPLGGSKHDVLARLTKAGFGGHISSVSNLGVASSIASASLSNTNRYRWTCPEIFDEHAAFVLHLKSYVMACGIVPSRNDTRNDSTLFRRYMCPWDWPKGHSFVRASLPLVWKHNDKVLRSIIITEIEALDEQSVRNLFEETYKGYWDDYPSIRKMVKGVLNKEMAESRSIAGLHSLSSVASFYRNSGGIFLVALGVKQSSPDSTRCDEVVGFVGVRRCESKEGGTEYPMEVFRLAVASQYRGAGIGRKLLEAVENYARAVRSGKLMANTLTILHDACRLYSSCGYRVVVEFPLGDNLTMKKYEKDISYAN